MAISFEKVTRGALYSRHTLAGLWGYTSFHAIARGVVTPRDDNKIVLFVTEKKQSTAEQYADRLSDNVLEWDGPTDHFAEDRSSMWKRAAKKSTFFTENGITQISRIAVASRC